MADNFYNLKKVLQITSLCRSTLYKHMDDGIFPKPVKFGTRKVMWRREDIEYYLKNKGITVKLNEEDLHAPSFEIGFTAGCNHVLLRINDNRDEIGTVMVDYIFSLIKDIEDEVQP